MSLDAAVLEKFRPFSFASPDPSCWINFAGVETDVALSEHASQFRGRVVADLPIPNDGVYGGQFEHMSLLTAIDRRARKDRFTAVELGAAWGPWIAEAGVVCRRLGVRADLVGVEACPIKADAMRQHMRRNRLEATIIDAAVWTEDTSLNFPKALRMHDFGARPSLDGVDYRNGGRAETQNIKGLRIETICKDHPYIDYMHWDIQGCEGRVAQASAKFLDERVGSIFIGTHSRAIEGDLLTLFHSLGWDLLCHAPCGYTYNRTLPTLEAMGTTDGDMYFVNPKRRC